MTKNQKIILAAAAAISTVSLTAIVTSSVVVSKFSSLWNQKLENNSKLFSQSQKNKYLDKIEVFNLGSELRATAELQNLPKDSSLLVEWVDLISGQKQPDIIITKELVNSEGRSLVTFFNLGAEKEYSFNVTLKLTGQKDEFIIKDKNISTKGKATFSVKELTSTVARLSFTGLTLFSADNNASLKLILTKDGKTVKTVILNKLSIDQNSFDYSFENLVANSEYSFALVSNNKNTVVTGSFTTVE